MESINNSLSSTFSISSGIIVMEENYLGAQLKVNGYTYSFVEWAEKELRVEKSFTMTGYENSTNVLNFNIGFTITIADYEFNREYRELITAQHIYLVEKFDIQEPYPVKINYSTINNNFEL